MTRIRPYPLARALASYILPRSIFERPGSGGTFSGEYCYSVWNRHLHYLLRNELFGSLGEVTRIAEIGPGDSLGIGLAALYCGVDEYYAFDVIEHASTQANKRVNDELQRLYRSRCDIPNSRQQIRTYPELPDYRFPDYLAGFAEDYFMDRHSLVDCALSNKEQTQVKIDYIVPWFEVSSGHPSEVDLIFSQAVMEHVSDIDFAYSEMYRWLRRGGAISHQIDFKTHEMTEAWNGHWYISGPVWNFLLHGRKYPINRLPLSSHIDAIEKAGFSIQFVLPVTKVSPFGSAIPKVKGASFTEDDLMTSGALIQAVKQ